MSSFDIMSSTVCNLKCKHCGMDNSLHKNSSNYEKIKESLLKENEKDPIKTIYLWGGEPLLGDLDKILDIMDTFPNAHFKMTSNLCMPLTEKRLEIIKRCGSTFTSFDPKIRFGSVKNLSLWYHNCKKVLSIRDMTVICTVTKHVVENTAQRYVDFFNKIGFTKYQFSPIVLAGHALKDTGLEPKRDDYEKFMYDLVSIEDEKNKDVEVFYNHLMYCCMYRHGTKPMDAEGNVLDCYIRGHVDDLNTNFECLKCDNYNDCGGRSPCNPHCMFDRKVYNKAIETYKKLNNIKD